MLDVPLLKKSSYRCKKCGILSETTVITVVVGSSLTTGYRLK